MNRRRRMDRTKTWYGTLQSIPGTVERNNKGHKSRDHTIQVKPYTRTDAKDADREQRRIQQQRPFLRPSVDALKRTPPHSEQGAYFAPALENWRKATCEMAIRVGEDSR